MVTPGASRDASLYLGRNLVGLRQARRLTQSEVAARARVPRSTIANLESGTGNPSLRVLVKVANALEVPIDELVAAPRLKVRKYAKDEIPELRRRGHGVVMRPLVPDPTPEALVSVMELDVGGVMPGSPHLAGTREFFTLLSGSVEITVAGARFELEPGEVLAFPGNAPHGYRNTSRGPSRGVSCVLLAHKGV